eukprot:scaffold237_cov117-Isochrysis_galbana.AAC.8
MGCGGCRASIGSNVVPHQHPTDDDVAQVSRVLDGMLMRTTRATSIQLFVKSGEFTWRLSQSLVRRMRVLIRFDRIISKIDAVPIGCHTGVFRVQPVGENVVEELGRCAVTKHQLVDQRLQRWLPRVLLKDGRQLCA